MPIFAIDTKTGERMWTYRGDNILHTTIAIGPERMYFIDSSITPEERQQLYLQDKGDLKKLTGEAAQQGRSGNEKARRAVGRCARSPHGRKAVGKAGQRDRHDQRQRRRRQPDADVRRWSRRACAVPTPTATTGNSFWRANSSAASWLCWMPTTASELWSKNANYMNRPAVIGNEIFAEPWAFDLHTGEPKTRPHPLTGEDSQWRFSRPGHHCGVITATPNMMFFRSGFIGYYDLYQDSGTRHFAGQRLGCWINAIPGNGLVMIPEASAGLRLPVLDRVDGGDGTEDGKQVMGHLQRGGPDHAGQADGNQFRCTR